ncbi:MAG TPA: hypothetical protein VHB72_02140 [Candidatus Saccharimonadales bacterium]|nr:hypothetical protein [Candidatus Saccharimonadales bacterium]
MARLPQTEQALSEVFANQQILYGVHGSEELRTNGLGVYVGERAFRPERDKVSDINPLSIAEAIYDEPHVPLIIPDRPLSVSVVTHERQQPEEDVLGIIPSKRRLASEIADSLYDTMPGLTDRVFQYAVGEAAGTVKGSEIEVIGTDGNPLTDAETIAELCQDGLTFVISDFHKLPLEETEADFPMAVAVKANHTFDVKLPKMEKTMRVAIGNRGGEVNLGNEEEVAAINEKMAAIHANTVLRLQRAGLAVAHIVMEPAVALGFSTSGADRELAAAINSKNPDKA